MKEPSEERYIVRSELWAAICVQSNFEILSNQVFTSPWAKLTSQINLNTRLNKHFKKCITQATCDDLLQENEKNSSEQFYIKILDGNVSFTFRSSDELVKEEEQRKIEVKMKWGRKRSWHWANQKTKNKYVLKLNTIPSDGELNCTVHVT